MNNIYLIQWHANNASVTTAVKADNWSELANETERVLREFYDGVSYSEAGMANLKRLLGTWGWSYNFELRFLVHRDEEDDEIGEAGLVTVNPVMEAGENCWL